jgi:hypothetical protein
MWEPRNITIRTVSQGLREVQSEVYAGLFAVHRDIAVSGRFHKKVIGTTHLPSGLSMRNAIGVYYEVAEAKEALEIAAKIQNDWTLNCDFDDSDLIRVRDRLMEAIKARFGNEPFDRLAQHGGPGRPKTGLWLNGANP